MGIWALQPDRNLARDILIEYPAKNMIKDKKIVIKSPEVSMHKFTDSDDARTYLRGKDYIGDAVPVY